VPVGEVENSWVKGDAKRHYWQARATKKMMQGGKLKTGDTYYRDAEGSIVLRSL